MEDYIKKKVEVIVRKGHTTRIKGALDRQVLKYLNRSSRTSSGKDELQECTKGIRMQKYLREKLLPPHLMHCSNFSGRIYVEKTPE